MNKDCDSEDWTLEWDASRNLWEFTDCNGDKLKSFENIEEAEEWLNNDMH